MRMKLLLAAAMAATLATPALADKSDKRTDDPDKPVVKGDERGELPSLREVFDTTEYEDLFQQQRVEQDGDYNDSEIDQTEGRQGLASLIQEGNRNTSYISQSDRPDAAGSPFSFAANIAIVDQEGNRNHSYVEQIGDNRERRFANRADVHQVGRRNNADVFQAYNDQGLVVVSQGDDGTNEPSPVQDNTAYVAQVASTDSAVFVTQTGDGNEAYVVQEYAYESKVALQQDGNYDYAEIYQTGAYNDIHALQTGGEYNELYIDQDGYLNFIAVEQDGSYNVAEISQGADVSNNGITLLQVGYGNYSYNAQ